MLQTRIWKSIKSLPAAKRNGFEKFLLSPYFNQRKDLVLLYHFIEKNVSEEIDLKKETVWKSIFPNQKFSESKLRLLMSYLQRLFEQFIAVEEVVNNKITIKLKTASWFRNQGMENLHESILKDTSNQLEKQPLRNADYFYHRYQLEVEKYKIAYRKKPDKSANFQKVIDDLDLAFLSMKLRQSCLLLAHDKIYRWGFDKGFLKNVFEYLDKKRLLDNPAIGMYFYCYKMLENSEKEEWFHAFKNELLKHGHLFDQQEVQDLFLMAINYCIRRVNDGFRNYFQDIMDFYKEGLEKEYLLQNGLLSRFTYHNIVSVALQIDQADWAEEFIENWTNRLERRFRERMFSFNQAKIAYHRKDYDEAIPLLQRANYHDLLLNLGARTLLLKIYFELGEFDLLQSHLDAFSSYLRRKPGLSYHKTNYRNLIRYTNRLLSIQKSDKEEVRKFKLNVNKEEILTEKEWLLKRIEFF